MSSTTTTTPYTSSKRVRLPGVGREVEDILLWRDVRISAAAFVGLTLLYLLLEWSGYSLLTIISNTLLALVSVAFLWSYVAKFTNGSGPPVPRVVKEGVSEGQFKAFAQNFTVPVNKALSFLNRLISGDDIILTVEAAIGLYIFAKIGNYFSSLGLLYTLVVLAFSVPKIYELKKDDIDRAVTTASEQGRTHYKNYVDPYLKKIPKASTSSSTSNITAPATKPSPLESEADSYTAISKEGIPTDGGLSSGGNGGASGLPSSTGLPKKQY